MKSLPKDLKPIIDSIDDQLNNGSNEAGSFAVSGQEASNQELQKLMGMIPDAIFRLNSKGVILDFYSSDQWDTLIPPSEFINKPLDQTELPKNIVEAAMEKIKEALNSDQMQIHEYSLEMNDEIRYFESRYVKVEKDVVLSMVRDVTEWKNIQVEIEESEKKYRNLIQLAPEALMIFNLDLGKFVEYNAEAERLFGYSGDELLEMNPADLVMPIAQGDESEIELYRKVLSDLQSTGKYLIERKVKRADGSELFVELRAMLLPDPDFTLVRAAFIDITERKNAERLIVESEAKYRTLIDHAPEAIIVIDAESGLIVDLNEVAVKNFGYSREVLMKNGLPGLHEKIQGQVRIAEDLLIYIDQVVDDKLNPVFEAVVNHSLGYDIYLEIRMMTLPDSESNLIRASLIDITNRILTRQEFEESKRIYRRIIEKGNDVVFIAGPEGRFEYVNSLAQILTEYSPEELVGKRFISLVRKDWRKKVLGFYARQMRYTIPRTIFEFPIVTKTGKEKWVEQSTTVLFDNGELSGYEGAVRDITDRKEVEEELIHQALVFENIHDSVLIFDINGIILDCNLATETMFGFTKRELIGEKYTILMDPDNSEDLLDSIRKKIEDDHRWMAEVPFIRKDGSAGFNEAVIVPYYDNDSKQIGVISVNHDVTERKKAEINLLEQKQLFENLVEVSRATMRGTTIDEIMENALDIACRIGQTDIGTLFIINPAKEVTRGIIYYEGEYSKLNYADIEGIMAHGSAKLVAQNQELMLIADTEEFEYWHVIQSADYGVRSALTIPLLSGDNLIGILTLMNKQTNHFNEEQAGVMQAAADHMSLALRNAQIYEDQKQLAKHQATLYETFEAVGQHLDKENVIKSAVETIHRLTEWTTIAIMTPNIDLKGNISLVQTDWSGISPQGSIIKNIQTDKGIVGRAYRSRETQIVKNVELDEDYFEGNPGIKSEICVPILRGEEFKGVLDIQFSEFGYLTKDNILLAESLADVIALALENADLFDEIQKTAERLREVDRLKSTFLANVSHEIRTPMNAVIGMSNLLANTDLDKTQREFINIIRNSGDGLLSIINDILDLTKIEADKLELELVPFSLRSSIDECIKLMIPAAVEKGIELIVSYPSNLPNLILGDRNRLRQILVNLISNGIKFTNEGEVVVSVSPTLINHNKYEFQFSIKDSGIGIPDYKIGDLFQPFSQVDTSTTRQYGGSGLGLAISKRLVEMMGGKIWVESEEGSGSTFSFTIILSSTVIQKLDKPEPSGKETIPRLATSLPLNILVAEDNSVNQKVIMHTLDNMGYSPVIVDNGLEVMREMETSDFDVILMDIQMPKMDGVEATKNIRKEIIQERQPWIIGLSAHALTEDRDRCLQAGMNDYIQKPFKIFDLVNSLQKSKLGSEPKNILGSPQDRGANGIYQQLRNVLGDSQALDEVIQTYLEETPKKLKNLRKAVDQRDFQTIVDIANSLKSTSLVIGIDGMDNWYNSIVESADRRDLSEIPTLIMNIEAGIKEIEKSLLSHISQ